MLGRLLRLARDDQWRAGFVDENGVDFVHDGIHQVALHHLFRPHDHVVTQVVEAELVVGAVGDVSRVRLPALFEVETGHDDADRQAQETVNVAHPFGVAFGQVVVDGDDVDAPARQRVEVNRERRGKGFPFTRLHLGDAALMEHDAGHDLRVVVPLSECALSRLPHARKGFRQQIVQSSPLPEPLLELACFGP